MQFFLKNSLFNMETWEDGLGSKKVSEELRVSEPIEPIQLEPIHAPPPRKSSRIFCPPEWYLDIISEDVEKVFFTENEVHGDDPKTYDDIRYQL